MILLGSIFYFCLIYLILSGSIFHFCLIDLILFGNIFHFLFYIDLILFGNKCDLASKRQVATGTAKDYAESIGAEHLEMSALSSHGKASVSGANIRLKITKPWHYIALFGCSFST